MAGQRLPSAQELTAALEAVHSRLVKMEQKEEERTTPATQENVRQFFLPKTVKQENIVKNETVENQETTSLEGLRLLLQAQENEKRAREQQQQPQTGASHNTMLTPEMLQNLYAQLGEGTTSSGSGGGSVQQTPLNVVPNQTGGVTLTTEQYYPLLSAVKGKKKKIFPPRRSSRGTTAMRRL